jgi:hypothetical protein
MINASNFVRTERKRAEVCLELAQEAKDPYTKEAMMAARGRVQQSCRKAGTRVSRRRPITQAEQPFEG